MHNITQVLEAKKYISEKIDIKPKIGLILGSGLGSLADEFAAKVIIPYHEIPYFAKSEAIGHANELIIGKISNDKNKHDAVAKIIRIIYRKSVNLE